MKSILDPTFVYVKSEHTDIRKTFERVREENPPKRKVKVVAVNVAKRRREDRD
jgi:hypothetical protein